MTSFYYTLWGGKSFFHGSYYFQKTYLAQILGRSTFMRVQNGLHSATRFHNGESLAKSA